MAPLTPTDNTIVSSWENPTRAMAWDRFSTLFLAEKAAELASRSTRTERPGSTERASATEEAHASGSRILSRVCMMAAGKEGSE